MSCIKRTYPLIIKKEPKHTLCFINCNKLNKLNKSSKELPAIVDLRPQMPGVFDQGELGSCTAQAFCGILGFLNPLKPAYSRLFLYYCERFIRNSVEYDSGATMKDGILALQQFGICREATWAYNIKNYALKPPMNCYSEALLSKVSLVQNIKDTIINLKKALNSGLPFVCGIAVYESFESEDVAKTGIVPLPNTTTEQLLGGHAICVVGYIDESNYWIVRNSWGSKWGDKGYFYLPYSYLLDDALASDFWTILKPFQKKR